MSLIILDSAASGGSTFTVTINDSVAVTDGVTITFIGTLVALLSDSVSASDSSTIELDYGRFGSDTTSVSDVGSSSSVYLRNLSDTVSITDSIVRDLSSVRSSADTVVFSDNLSISSGITYSEAINDSITIVDVIVVPGAGSVIISDTIILTDGVLAQKNPASAGTPIVIVVGQLKDPNLLEKLILKIAQNPPISPLQAVQAYTGAYEEFTQILAPKPITIGRRIIFENTLLPLFSGAGTPPQFISTMIQGFTNYWMGMPVTGGVVTAFTGVPVMAAGLQAMFSTAPNSDAQMAKKLAAILTLSTFSVLYVIPPAGPLPMALA